MTTLGGWIDRLRGRTSAPRTAGVSGVSLEEGPAELIARAYALADDGKPGAALRAVVEALETRPGDADLLGARANLLARAGRMHEAIDAYRKARAGGAASPAFLVRHAWALNQSGAPAQARTVADELLAATPNDPDALCVAALIARAAGDPAGCVRLLRSALERRPEDPRPTVWLAEVDIAGGDPARGASRVEALLAAHPEDLAAQEVLAHARMLLGNPPRAIAALDRLISLADAKPGQNATSVARRARVNRALQRYDAGATDVALQDVIGVLREGPDIAAQFQLAVQSIAKGWFGEGWKRYSVRWLVEPYAGRRPHAELPRWSGQSLAGQKILVSAEQGIGDVIMFGRFLPEMKRRGATVLLVVEGPLRRLAAALPGVDRVVVAGESTPQVDFFVSLGDLMSALAVELDTVPRDVPYLTIEPSLRSAWARRLGDGDALKVGLVWAGNPKHVRDADRSMPAAALGPLLTVDGVRFHSLQKGPQAVELAQLAQRGEVVDLAPELNDFAETLAAIEALDLVVSVDTSVAHAAGALGKPVWMFTSTPAEYRWLEGRADTVWYPTMRLFRQHRYREWAPVVEDLRQALQSAVAARRRGEAWQSVRAGDWHRPMDTPDLAGAPDVVEARDGVYQIPSGTTEPALVALATLGEFLPAFRDLLLRLAPPGGAIIEIGAGYGEFTLALARRLGDDGRLLAVEPAASRHAYLAQNLAGNRIRNASVIATRVDDPSDDASIDALFVDRLDGVVLRDVHERDDVLGGAERTLWAYRPWVAAESASLAALRTQARRLAGCGYRCWTVVLPMFETMNYNRAERDAFDGAVRHGLLAFPEERDQALPPDRFSEVGAEA